MTLPEAVAHIAAADGCEPDAARRQLTEALNDAALRPLRWRAEAGDVVPPRIVGSSMIVPGDEPPVGRVWSGAAIDWENGRVRDDFGDYNHDKLRVLLLPRLQVERLWKPTPKSEGAKPQSETRRTGGNKPYNDESEIAATRDLLRSGQAKSVREAVRLVVEAAIDDRRLIMGASRQAWEERIRTKLRKSEDASH